MRILILLIAFVTVFASCTSKPDQNAVLDYYGKIQAAMLFHHDEQQKFIDTATEVIIQLQHDVLPDTKRLWVLLDNAKNAAEQRRKMIDTLKEVDEDINYKQKVLEYTDSFINVYNHEFTGFIKLLEPNFTKEQRLAFLTNQLQPKLQGVKDKETEVSEAKDEMMRKYNLQNVDALIEKGAGIVKERTKRN